MPWPKALVLVLLAAGASCDPGQEGPLGSGSFPLKSRRLAGDLSELGRGAPAPKPKPKPTKLPLLPFCTSIATWDKKKNSVTCNTLIGGLSNLTAEVISGKGNSTNSTIVNVIQTTIITKVQNAVVDTMTTFASSLANRLNKTTPSEASFSADVGRSIEPSALNQTEFNDLIVKVGNVLGGALLNSTASATAAEAWDATDLSKAVNVRLRRDLTEPQNEDALSRKAVREAVRKLEPSAADPLGASLLAVASADSPGTCGARIKAALEPGGLITIALLNATTGTGGAVAGVALSEAKAALSEALAAPNGTIVAALADAASALSAAVLARAAAGVVVPASDLGAAWEQVVAKAIKDAISSATTPDGAILLALANATSALSQAFAAAAAAAAGSGPLQVALDGLSDTRAAASYAAGGAFVKELSNATSPLSLALDALVASVVGGAGSLASLNALIANATAAGGLLVTAMSTNGSAVNVPIVNVSMGVSLDQIAADLLADGAICTALATPNSPADTASLSGLAAALGDDTTNLSIAVDARVNATVTAALAVGTSSISVEVKKIGAAAAKAGVAARMQEVADAQIRDWLPLGSLCPTGTLTLTVNDTAFSAPADGEPISFGDRYVNSPACPANTFFAWGFCSLRANTTTGATPTTFRFRLAEQDVDYTNNYVRCVIQQVVATNPAMGALAENYNVAATGICCNQAPIGG